MLTPEEHALLTAETRRILLMEKQCTGLSNQIWALKSDGRPDVELAGLVEARDLIWKEVSRWKRQLARGWRDLPVVQWANGVHGLGDAVVLTLGTIPRLVDFPNPAKLWAYGGLCPGRGPKKGENHKYSRELKSFAIKRLAEPCMKSRESPYRRVYDERRAHTLTTHPDWSDGHSHNDALRITAKAILLDIWLVANGRDPKVGHARRDAQTPRAHPDPSMNGGGGQFVHDAHTAVAPAATPEKVT
jgi:hypothetical protein